jgi:hypothetical protein
LTQNCVGTAIAAGTGMPASARTTMVLHNCSPPVTAVNAGS